MTALVGVLLLLLVVAAALRLLFSGNLKATLYGIGLIVLLGSAVPVIIPATLPAFLQGLVVALAVVGAITVLVAIVRLMLRDH